MEGTMNDIKARKYGPAFVERFLVAAGLIIISVLAWAYTVQMARTMESHTPVAGVMAGHGVHHTTGHGAMQSAVTPHLAAWGAEEIGMTFMMWAVMMAAMMLPTAVPMILAFTVVNRPRESRGAIMPVWIFTSGYLSTWIVYSAGATVAQWGLLRTALLSPVTLVSAPVLGGFLLIAAGIFQWTPWKDACMAKCRNPMGFLLAHWRPGNMGAFTLGSRYGLYCVGCCWLLMTLSFALGVMNLAWMAALTVFMLIEKISPAGRLVSRAAGIGLTAWGIWMLFR
jgi:predicted metal-binding membrane protein